MGETTPVPVPVPEKKPKDEEKKYDSKQKTTFEKYLKYKMKYLKLRKSLNMNFADKEAKLL